MFGRDQNLPEGGIEVDSMQKIRNIKAGSRLIAAFCLALLLGGCGSLATASPDPGLTEEQKKEEMTYFVLTPAEGTEDSDLEISKAMVLHRVELLAGDTEYFLEEEDRLRIWMDPSCFDGEPTLDYLRSFVIRPGIMHLADTISKEDLGEALLLRRDDVESAELVTGLPDSMTEARLPFVSPSGSYLKLVLADSFTEEHREELDALGKAMTLMFDTELVLNGITDTVVIYYIYMDADGKTLYAASEQENGKKLEKLKWFIEEPDMPARWSAMIIDAIDWIAPEEMKEAPGSLQITKEEITGTWCRLELAPSSGTLSAEEQEIVLRCIAARLDCLERPYALGRIRNGNGGIAVAVGTERMGLLIADLLGSRRGFVVQMQEKMGYSINDFDLRLEEDPKGRLSGLRIDGSESQKDKLSRITDEGIRAGEERIFLFHKSRDIMIASAKVQEPVGDGKILLTDNGYLSGDPVTEKDRWFYSFLALVSGDELPEDLGARYLIIKEDGTYGSEQDFGIGTGK